MIPPGLLRERASISIKLVSFIFNHVVLDILLSNFLRCIFKNFDLFILSVFIHS